MFHSVLLLFNYLNHVRFEVLFCRFEQTKITSCFSPLVKKCLNVLKQLYRVRSAHWELLMLMIMHHITSVSDSPLVLLGRVLHLHKQLV